MSFPPQGLDKGDVLTNQATIIAKTDNLPSDPASESGAIYDETEIVERHLHNRERWFGKSGDQSGNDWAVEAGLTPFRAISGDGVFGADANDEAKVLGTDDTPAIAGMTKFDPHRLMVTAASNANDWVLRFIYGTGTMAEAESAGQYTDVMVQEAKKGSPVDIMKIRCTCGLFKLWVRAKNATNNATIDFFIGIHEYPT